jgi:murein DD-endopeptidase MepM/ murein hydrolase activator NlpD
MLVSVVRANRRGLTRGAALVVLAGMAAGCSSQVARFNGVDDVFTGSTPNQRAIINGENQPYPGDSQPAAPLAPTQTTSVSRGALEPVTTQPLAPPTAAPAPVSAPIARAPAPAAAPERHVLADPKPVRKTETAAAPAPRAVDETTTGTIEPRKAQPNSTQLVSEEEPEGWSRAGGTQVTAKEGETVYNLSRRFGVPANVILRVNGLSEGSGLQAGQKVIIPTYVYSSKAPVSAPDSNPKVAASSSSTGLKKEQPTQKIPLPEHAPQDHVAVLPQTKKLKDSEKAKPLDTASADDTKTVAPKPVEEKTASAEKSKGRYVVQSGDTLQRIAKKSGVSVAALKSANNLKDGGLKIGQKLVVPAASAVVAEAKPAVDPASTGSTEKPKKLAPAEAPAVYTPPTKKADKTIEQAETSDDKAPDATGIARMRWPVKGRVISAFGKSGGKANDGIDIAVPEGTAVKAAENGVVIYAGDGLKDFGNTVLVRHEDGLVTVYGNASELKVQRGQKVKRGEQIAVSGMSGNASSPKLHFEVRKNSAPVDPSTFLE